MERPRPSGVAWSALGLGILAYEALAKDDELLTDHAYRGIDNENMAIRCGTYIAVGTTALHLLRLIPKTMDPYFYLAKVVRYNRNVT